jgi:hypothetical protein
MKASSFSMRKKVSFVCFSVMILGAFISSCGVSHSRLLGAGDSALIAPSWVTASADKNGSGVEVVNVSWEDVAESYALYRRIGGGEWEEVSSNIADASFLDSEYYEHLSDPKHPLVVEYSVCSLSGLTLSERSPVSAAVTPVVLETNASCFSRSDGIRVQWESNPDADGYRVYRYENQIDSLTPPVLVQDAIPQASGTLQWDDTVTGSANPPSALTVYYYLIAWTRAGVEYGRSGTYANGAYSAEIDRYEPNNSRTDLSGGTSVFSVSQPPLTYVISDGYGGTTNDADWYSVETDAGKAFSVFVTLPSDTAFESGDLTFRFYYNGVWYPTSAPEPLYRGLKGTNEFVFSSFPPGVTGVQTIYFAIAPKPGITRNVIGTYGVEINK